MSKTQKSAELVQQELGGVYGSQNIIPWDLYNKTDKKYLIDKVKLLIPDVTKGEKNEARETKKLEKIRNSLVTAIWNQRKYYGGALLMSISHVLLTESVEPVDNAKHSTEYAMHSIFRVRKCCVQDDSTNCCMVFVDENSRVYKNWEDYKENNTLPEGIVVAPQNGVYNFDDDDKVRLECFETPASSFLHKAGTVGNATAGVLGFGAAAVALSTLILPVAAPILAVSAVVGIGSSVWGTGSSISRLWDRGKHEEAIDPTNAQARSDWIGVAGGVVGLGAAGASTVLAKTASAGRSVPGVIRGTVNGLNIASIAVNGAGFGHGLFDMILKNMNDEEISVMDVAQLGVSLFLVTHSVYNFQTASKMIRSSQDKSINRQRSKLSNRQRKAFDQAYQETIRVRGAEQGKMDVIRALKNMPDSRQPLNDLYKIRSKLNKQNLKASFHPDGRVVINNDLVIDAKVLRANLHENVAIPAAPAPQSYSADNTRSTSLPDQSNPNSLPSSAIVIHVLNVIGNSVSLISNSTTLFECICNILNYVTEQVLEKLCLIARDFLDEFGRKVTDMLKRYVPYEEVLWKIFELIVEKCDGMEEINEWILKTGKKVILDMLVVFYNGLKPVLGKSVKCGLCRGYYTLVKC